MWILLITIKQLTECEILGKVEQLKKLTNCYFSVILRLSKIGSVIHDAQRGSRDVSLGQIKVCNLCHKSLQQVPHSC